MKYILPVIAAYLSLSCLLSSQESSKDNSDQSWPQWRGPTRDGFVSQNAAWPSGIGKSKLKLKWRKKIDKGYPGPVVSKHLVFTVETLESKNEVVRAFDRATGEQRWESSWEGSMRVPFFARKNGSWVRSTPIYDGKNLYVGGIRDYLVTLDAETGKKVWQIDFTKKFDSPVPGFGLVCSPMVHDGSLYVQAGSGLVRVDTSSGKILWRSLNDEGGMHGSAFSSPVFQNLLGKDQILTQTRNKLAGVSPADGKVFWSQSIKAFRGMNILTPAVYKNNLFTSSYGGRSVLLGLSNKGEGFSAEQKWDNPQQGYMSSPIIIGDYCYLHLRKQRFTCIDLKTGETKWISPDTYGKYWSMVTNGDEILALDERGELHLIEANPEKLVIKQSRKVADQECWAHLAVADKQIFVRELEAIACYEFN